MAVNPFYNYSGSFIPGTLARAELESVEFTSVQQGFAILAIQGVDSGAANAYVVTTKGGQNGIYADGMIVEFKAANSNTGGSTIAVDGGATVSLTSYNGQALTSNALSAGTWYRALYNSTYSAFTLIAPTSLVTTSNTISTAAPTHLVGLTAAGGNSTACAPIDVTFALDQSISPTWSGSHTFAGAVAFNSSVSFATGLSLTGGVGQYAATLTGAAASSFGLKINAGVTSGDLALLVNNQSGSTQYFAINGQGSVTVGNPTGGAKGVGTINATGLYVNGAAVQTSAVSSANPSATIGLAAVNGTAATFMTSDSAPALSQAIVPTWTGAHTFSPSSAVVAITLNAAVNAHGLVVNGGTNTSNTYLAQFITGQGAGFSSGVYISAGTNSSDTAFEIQNAAQTHVYMAVNGDGSGALGWNGSANTIFFESTGETLIRGELVVQNPAGATSLFAVTGNTSGVTVEGYGPTAGTLVDMTPDSGTFTLTYSNSIGSGTAVWSKNGKQITLTLPAAVAVSTSATLTAATLPTEIQPTRTQFFVIGVENDSSISPGQVSVTASGTITFYPSVGANASSWSNVANKGVPSAVSITYLLN
jgi:hypothetical protein